METRLRGGATTPSRRPQRAEVDGRVAGLPAAEEALQRRVESDVVELPWIEKPMTADGGVLGSDALEGPAGQIGRKDDVNDMAADEGTPGSDRVDHRDRSLERQLLADPHLLLELPPQSLHEAFSPVDAAA